MHRSNLVDILRDHAEARPEAGALAFLADGESLGPRLSFAALDHEARALGATLQQLTEPGDRALLIYQPGLEFAVAFIACQYAGVTAIPAPPPNDRRIAATMARVDGIVRSARPSLLLTTAKLLPGLRAAARESGLEGLAQLRWQASDRVDLARAGSWTPPRLAADQLSFLQYTSGSTSAPKGVMVSHANLIANLEMIEAVTDEARNVVSWLPMFHDMGLIGNLLYGIYRGTESHLMSPLSFLKQPLRWLRAISGREEVVSGGPNFAYEAVLRRLRPGDEEGLDLRGWKVAFCGAETVRADTLSRFAEAFAPVGLDPRALLPCYGLAEATLIVTARSPGARYRVRDCDREGLTQGVVEAVKPNGEVARVVSCGSGQLDQQLAIVDPDTRERCPDGRVGEIWVRGSHVASGYFGDVERTAASFAATTSAGEGPFMRTGDLGFVDGGELYVTGRIKEIIIVRGRCIYPQDLERAVEGMIDSFPELVPEHSAAFALVDGERERVGLIVKVARRKNPAFDPEALIEAIQARVLADFEVSFDEIALTRTSIPKTSSGKSMRTLCADRMGRGLEEFDLIHRWQRPRQGALEHDGPTPAMPSDHSPARVADLIVAWIAREEGVDPARISTVAPLTDLGLDSVAVVELIDHLERELDIPISSTILERHRTIDALVHELAA